MQLRRNDHDHEQGDHPAHAAIREARTGESECVGCHSGDSHRGAQAGDIKGQLAGRGSLMHLNDQQARRGDERRQGRWQEQHRHEVRDRGNRDLGSASDFDELRLSEHTRGQD